MIDTTRARDFGSVVARPVVDDQRFDDVGYLLHSGNPNLLRSGLAADTRGHRRAVVFGDQATALHPKTA